MYKGEEDRETREEKVTIRNTNHVFYSDITRHVYTSIQMT